MVCGDIATGRKATSHRHHLEKSSKRPSWYHFALKVHCQVCHSTVIHRTRLTTQTGVTGKGRIYSWYQTSFDIPAVWAVTDRVMLNFGAVDYEATVFINGKNATFHRGGYFEFSVDVTPYLNANEPNELYVTTKLDQRAKLIQPLQYCPRF